MLFEEGEGNYPFGPCVGASQGRAALWHGDKTSWSIGNRNLKAAALWVQTFPAGPLQDRAVQELEGIEQYQQELARNKPVCGAAQSR